MPDAEQFLHSYKALQRARVHAHVRASRAHDRCTAVGLNLPLENRKGGDRSAALASFPQDSRPCSPALSLECRPALSRLRSVG